VSDRAPSAAEIRRAEAADRGAYRVAFVKGRQTAAGQAAMAAPAVQAAAGVGVTYVQVGAFAQAANAERAIAMLKGLGLPVSVGVGGRLKVILAGPFDSPAQVSNALALVRRNGYRDAFPRRG
jgi:cell division septation protein DedD